MTLTECVPLATPVLAVGERAPFQREDAVREFDERLQAHVDYTDLAGNAYHTDAEYQRSGSNASWVVQWVRPEGAKPKRRWLRK